MKDLSNNQKKRIRSLHKRKYRQLESQFIAEGEKLVKEAINSDVELLELLATTDWEIPEIQDIDFTRLSPAELKSLSGLKSPNKVLAVLSLPKMEEPIWDQRLHLYLDGIRDPGNMGTIMRIADWYGLTRLFLSPDCTDPFAPKVVQASMGSLFHLQLHELDYTALRSANRPIIGATLSGCSIYEHSYQEGSILCIGSESHGLRKELLELLASELSIPAKGKAESLNAGVATAIFLDRLLN